MADRKLKSYVHVHRVDDDGQDMGTEAFGPDDSIPAWAVPLIGDHCYASEDDVDESADDEPKVAHVSRTRRKS